MPRSRRQFQRPRWVTPRGARWLLGTSPVLVILLIFAIKALSMVGVNSAGISAYDEGRFAASRDSFAQLSFGNVFQPWIADYNRGTAEYRLRDYAAARESFTAALDRVPAEYECRVVLNLVATIERQGDELAAQQQPRDAAEHYEDALRLLSDTDCGDPSATPSPSPDPSSSPSADPSPTTDPSPTADPSADPSGDPTSDPSGEPSSDPSGEPTSDPDGEPDPDSEPQSDEERREQEAQRKQEQEERIGEKAEEQRKNSERRDRDPSQSSEPEPSAEPDSDPSGEQQRREELEQRNQDGQQEQNRRRDRDERPRERSDTPW